MKRMLTVLAVVMTAAAVQIVQAAGERWASQATSDTIQAMPAVKTFAEALTSIPLDTTKHGLFVIIH